MNSSLNATLPVEDFCSQKVFIIDDNKDVRESLSFLLRSVQLNVETFATGSEFLSSIDPHTDGCAIIDILMPTMSGTELLKELKKKKVYFPVIMLTAHADVPVAVESMRLGAYHFLQKNCLEQELIDCVRNALRFSRSIHHECRNEIELQKLLDSLSNREKQVMELVVEGQTSRQVADNLGIAVKTVDAHRANMMKKLGVNNVAELIHKVIMYRSDDIPSES
ncbi:response regulator [Rubinisphaera sp.]|uniref:response regulator transcription factor n=1 Tax=Rubinisphaera sp. TaxID=2024857 RepID=UPI000C11B2E9|nr:response regulator [Rubinisphaera sp.]MBV10806.1 DNA-binding response regulator [Rubinisphaera sp.]HCS52056.1 DNA-binding response regulator [Planctomycetaceae bacterium]|tara:strand:- start:11090 stop:11755 length:666 start_codon:yes stop_codon:yes gene_type:complete